MSHFNQLPEFQREFKKLSKKYPSLRYDIEDIKAVLVQSPTGIGKNFTIIKIMNDIKIIKARIHCESLRARTIRLIYAYHADQVTFMYIELYAKGDKENEDRARIDDYINKIV